MMITESYKKRALILVVLCVMLTSCGIRDEKNAIIYVPDNYSTIQEAINNFRSGQKIIVMPGIYNENIVITSKDVILKSSNPDDIEIVENTIIDGGRNGSVIYIEDCNSGVIIEGFTVKNGSGDKYDDGGGIYINNSSAYISKNVIIENFVGGDGGGIYIRGKTSSVNISDNQIKDNQAYGSISDGAGITITNGKHTVQNNTITNNKAGLSGGGIYIYSGDHIIEGNTFTNNTTKFGGGLDTSSAYVVVKNNTFESNTATNSGGAFNIYSGICNVSNNVFTKNTGYKGGALNVNEESTATIIGNRFELNYSTRYNGGAIYAENSSSVVDDQGNALSIPDTLNEYIDNNPDDIYYFN